MWEKYELRNYKNGTQRYLYSTLSVDEKPITSLLGHSYSDVENTIL